MKSRIRFCAILFILFGVLHSCLVISKTRANSFIDTQIVDSTGDFGTQSSLALDSKGNPHISYTCSNMTGSYLMYARWTGERFMIQTIDANGATNPSIALDSNDNPKIGFACKNVSGSYLQYASCASSIWSIETIELVQNGSEISDPSLKLDINGFAHIGYVGQSKTLKYALWTGAAWNIEAIDPWTEQVADPSLALDNDGKPSISYFDPSIGLKCASWTGSGWNKMIVDSAPGVGKESSLALDSLGYPHISYDDDPNGNLKYANWNGSTWKIQIVDRNKHVSFHSSLSLDSYGFPHISYLDNANGNLMYASWTESLWNLRIIDQVKVVPGDLEVVWGFPTSLALDASGTAHISYCGYTRHDLKYASISDLPSFLVTFKLTGADDSNGKVLEVDSVELTFNDLPKSYVWREGSAHSFAFVSELDSSSEGKLFWSSTSGLSTLQSSILTISGEGTVTADYEASGFNPNISISLRDYVPGLAIVAVVIIITIVIFKRRKS